MFAKNIWYVAAWADEVGSKPLARTILDQPVVLFRGQAGQVAALEDRCCHRGLPLHHGEVIGDCLRCAYHGLEYDLSGVCVRIPGQDKIPLKARVKGWPVVERDHLIWIWMGDPDQADESKVAGYSYHDDTRWRYRKNTYLIKANHLLVYDNLLDLTHLGHVHKKTIGGDAETHFAAPTKTVRTDKGVRVERWMLDSVPPPMYSNAFPFTTERVDRWQEIEFEPSLVRIFTGAKDVGTGASTGNREGGCGFRGLNAMTPETAHTTHYFWSIANNFRLDEPAITDGVYESVVVTFGEDKVVIESQYENLQRQPERPLIDIGFDAGPTQARRIWSAMIELESEAARLTSPAIPT